MKNRVLIIASAVVLLSLGVLYFSPLNIVRNFHRSLLVAEDYRTPPTLPEEVLECNTKGGMWEEQQELYKQDWETTNTVSIPYAKESSKTEKFTLKKSILDEYVPRLTALELGDEYDLYAGVSAGDINHDGFLDLVANKMNQKVRVYLNDKTGNFIDVTACAFPADIPEDVEYVSLTDFNNDTHLDLMVVYSQFKKQRTNTIYTWNSQNHTFVDGGIHFGSDKRSIGGHALVDINNDKLLDFFLSYNTDYYSDKFGWEISQVRYKDEFWVSEKGKWSNKINSYFPEILADKKYTGMSALFTDIDRDGRIDFMLGNDFDDPSFIMVGDKDKKFSLIKADFIENNTLNSMSYFSMDFNNDGTFELWENGIANVPIVGKEGARAQNSDNPINASDFNKEIVVFSRDVDAKNYECDKFKNYYVHTICISSKRRYEAIEKGDIKICDTIVNKAQLHACRRLVQIVNSDNLPGPDDNQAKNIELFPPQIKENVLLKFDAQKNRYVNLKVNNDTEYTGWTWAAYPFDVNNDGFEDMFITNGYKDTHDVERLLINKSSNEKIDMKNEAKEYGVDVEDDGRGVIIADFQNNGSGDIVMNSFFTAPKYFDNGVGGNSIQVELRSKNSNYYAVGAQVELKTQKTGTQLREMRQGGIWNTSQPFRLHFGIPEGDTIEQLKIRWPDGHEQVVQISQHHKIYIIYE